MRFTRPAQRDRLATQQLTFELVDWADCMAFRQWYEVDLQRGGAWFSATWPLPQGWVSAVRRFVGQPRWDYIVAIGWRVTAECQLRGRGLAPVAP